MNALQAEVIDGQHRFVEKEMEWLEEKKNLELERHVNEGKFDPTI